MKCQVVLTEEQFQSAPPVREATSTPATATTTGSRFNPRPPCGRRQRQGRSSGRNQVFQSAPPVREATAVPICLAPRVGMFQSAPPVREATKAAL